MLLMALKIGFMEKLFERAILRGNEKEAFDIEKKHIGSKVAKVMIF